MAKHDVTPDGANEAVDDPERIVIGRDYNSTSAVIVLVEDNATYGVNAWRSNARDRRIYLEGER